MRHARNLGKEVVKEPEEAATSEVDVTTKTKKTSEESARLRTSKLKAMTKTMGTLKKVWSARDPQNVQRDQRYLMKSGNHN